MMATLRGGGEAAIAALWMAMDGYGAVNQTGWWLSHPSEKYEFVNRDDELPNIWKNKIHVPVTTNQRMIWI